MSKMGMVIDLHKCVGCGACGIACKTENNTQDRKNGQSYNWADFIFKMEGKFPDLNFTAYPVLCNHCSNAACVDACPVTPKAMFKTKDGITMHNDERCIGCRQCQMACPYSAEDLEGSDAEYSVISFNFDDEPTHPAYRSSSVLLDGMTSSGAEVSKGAGAVPPFKTKYAHPDYDDVRRKGIVEKCILCEHRIKNCEDPYCVDACPSHARVVGDLDDPNSKASRLLNTYSYERLQVEAGTEPNVYYIRSYKVK
ncbi:4Fe-4S dicluster domain-containing protein [Limisalsivibrio acetivorans]|uniref:4Fe-4S dicluster domain-containing protein n=1 Tax=Limisalsivibrio acetivorans TaxID=1304888 RepID=UPI0003B7A2FC|nr:4Fe-4S dicluster domain-containing protein [Limisalsivibrio acetivorans]